MNSMLIILVVTMLLAFAAALIIAVLRNKRVTKRRLDAIRNSTAYSASTIAPRKKQLLSSESFAKTKIASNERIKQITVAIENELNAAGLGDDPIRVIFAWIILIIVIPMIENLLGFGLLAILLTIAFAAIGPMLYLRAKKKKRQNLFEKQLPNAIDIICNALKAGYTFQFSLNNVTKELEDPIAEEFLMAYRETQYGASLSDALEHMAKRTSSSDTELLNVAVSVQTNVGGNMIEILQNISRTLVAKHELEEEIKVKTASGKLTGILLAVLPIFLLAALSFLNKEYVALFFTNRVGILMLAFSALWELIGFLFIRKILNVKY